MTRNWIKFFSMFLLLTFAFGFQIRGAQGDPTNKSFASFAYFIDQLKLPIGKSPQAWATPRSIYEGPFHTNDELHVYLPPGYFDESHAPFFRGPVSTVGKTIVYSNNYGPIDSTGQVDSNRFEMVFGGEVKTGAPRIPLPEHPEEQAKLAAYGNSDLTKMKKTRGIFLAHDDQNHLTGGIVFQGDLDGLVFTTEHPASGGKRLKMAFQSNTKSAVVEINFKDNKTSVSTPDGRGVAYVGIPNGAIYVSGHIGATERSGLEGKITGRWTLATEGDVFVTNDLVYSDTPAGNKPAGDDTMAIIARNVLISKRAPDMMYLYATVFAVRREEKKLVGTLFAMPTPDLVRHGNLIWWGNYIGEFPAIMGSFDRSTGESRDGFDLHKFYDARLADNPPPYFPTLPKGVAQTP